MILYVYIGNIIEIKAVRVQNIEPLQNTNYLAIDSLAYFSPRS